MHEANAIAELGMVCNKSKTEVVAFGDNDIIELTSGNDTIKTKKSMKVLGLWMDSELK